MITSPAAILAARYLRKTRWFPLHAATQLVTASFVIISFALGTRAVTMSGHGFQMEGKGASHHHRVRVSLTTPLIGSSG